MHLVLRATRFVALAGFVLGGIRAAFQFFGSVHVLEFQAGEGAGLGEKAVAIAHAAAIEGLGWGAVGLACALVADGLTRFGAREERNARFLSGFVLVVAAFFGALSITWVGEDALPFLDLGEVLLLDLVGLAGALTGFWLFVRLVRLLPFAPRGPSAAVACTLSGVVLAGLFLWFAQEVFLGVSGGYRSPLRIAVVGFGGLVALSTAAFAAKRTAPALERLGARLERGSLVPRPVIAVLLLGLLGCALGTAPSFQMSSARHDVVYDSLESKADSAGPNVVFVTVDTLRADHLSCYGYERPTSPFLDSLAAAGARFADPLSPASWTKPATGTIFTGLYPSRHGALYHGSSLRLPEGERTVAEAFQDAGYVTAGFVSNPNVKAVFDFDRGFDVFFDSPVEDTVTLACIRTTWFGRALMALTRHQFNWKYENDVRQMNEHVAGWLAENGDQRFFLYVHYIDPHIPYDPPSPWRGEFAQDHGFVGFNRRKELVGRDLYDAEIRYTDEGLSELVTTLEAAGAWDDTLFVLTSDHGEEFFEHEVLGHGFSLFQPVIGVPLILHGAGVPSGVVVEEPVEIVDLPATVVELAGLGQDTFGDGQSFAAALRDPSWKPAEIYFLENEFGQDDRNHRAFVFTGARKGRWKLVLTEQNAYFPPQNPENQSEALYDLDADPDELHNLIDDPTHREVVEELLAALRAHSEFLFETGFRDIEPAVLSPEIRANLEALGY